MSTPIQLIRLQPRRAKKRGLRVAARVALGALAGLLLSSPFIAAGIAALLGPDMLQALIFALVYLRNLPTFDGNHVRTLAATRMDMKLRELRKRLKERP